MKEASTPYTKYIQSLPDRITKDFLEIQGWLLIESKPLFDYFKHSNNNKLRCSIGLYGEFSIEELHWTNNTPEKIFNTINPNLTTEDYFSILKLLAIYVYT